MYVTLHKLPSLAGPLLLILCSEYDNSVYLMQLLEELNAWKMVRTVTGTCEAPSKCNFCYDEEF